MSAGTVGMPTFTLLKQRSAAKDKSTIVSPIHRPRRSHPAAGSNVTSHMLMSLLRQIRSGQDRATAHGVRDIAPVGQTQ